ncbi:MAG TPA: hypothetical protein VIJ47_00820 [Acidimicrobiales bacterium]
MSGPADCIKGNILTISVTGLGLTATVSGDAAWEVPFTVPTNAAPATYPVVVDNEECTFADGSLVVVEPATTTTTTAAPTTVAPTTTEPAAQAEAVTASPTFTG